MSDSSRAAGGYSLLNSMVRSAVLRGALAFVVLNAGCQSYQSASIDLSDAADHFETRSLTSPESMANRAIDAQPATAPAVIHWTFEQLLPIALQNNSTLHVAREHLATVAAAQQQAAESPNPSVSFAPSYATKADGANPWTLGWVLDIPLETAGKRGIRLAQASALTGAAQMALAESAWHVRSVLRDVMIEYVISAQEAAIFEREVASRKSYTDALTARLKAGEASRPEVAVASTDLLTVRQEWHAAQGRAQDARTRLAAALGMPVQGLNQSEFDLSAIDQIETIAKEQSPSLRRAALLNRLDLHRALLEYAAAEKSLQLEIARQYPDPHLGPGYTFDQGQNKWELGATLELPIFNQNQGAIAQARAHRAEQAAMVIDLQQQAIAELESALAKFDSAHDESLDAQEQYQALETELAAAQRGFEAGEQDRPTVTSIEIQRDVAARLRLDAILKARQALGAVEDAVQCPLEMLDAKPLNRGPTS